MKTSLFALLAALAASPALAASHGVPSLPEPAGIAASTWATLARQVWRYQISANAGPRVSSFTLANSGNVGTQGCAATISGAALNITSGTCTFTSYDFEALVVTISSGANASFVDSKFAGFGEGTTGAFWQISVPSGATAAFDHCLIDGMGARKTTVNSGIVSSGTVSLTHSRVVGQSGDGIDVSGGVATVADNYFGSAGWGIGAHSDMVVFYSGSGSILRNLFDTSNQGVVGVNNVVRVNPFSAGHVVTSLLVQNNIELGGIPLYPVQVNWAQAATAGSINNVTFQDNLWHGRSNGSIWMYPNPSGIVAASGDTNLLTGAALAEPALNVP